MVQLDDTCLLLTSSWKEIILDAGDVMFFGSPFNSSHSFAPLFVMKKQTSYLHQVFHQFALEYCGDTNASSQLYAAYLKRLVELKMKEVEEMPNKIREETVKQISNVTRSQQIFIQMFDGFCKSVSMGELSRWNKYNKPVVLDDNFDNFMHVSEHQAFGDLWRVLAGICGLNDKHKREANQTGYEASCLLPNSIFN